MAEQTSIEWTQSTWNPVIGCTKLSAGCDHGYAERFAERFRGVAGHPYEPGFDLTLRPERVDQPPTWRRPRHASRRPAIEREDTADEMHRHRSEELPDGKGAPADLGAGERGQEAEPQLAQQRHAPLVVGEPGTGLTLGQVRGGGAEIAVVPAQATPGVSDYFAEARAVGDAVVARSRTDRLPSGTDSRSGSPNGHQPFRRPPNHRGHPRATEQSAGGRRRPSADQRQSSAGAAAGPR